jgi:hypothetical protein
MVGSNVLLASMIQSRLPALDDVSAELRRTGIVGFESQLPALGWHAAGYGVLLAILILMLVRAATRRVFLLDVDASPAGSVVAATSAMSTRWQLERPVERPIAAKADVAKAKESACDPDAIDLISQRRAVADWRARFARPLADRSIHFRHFEVALEDAALREQALELLEDLVYASTVEIVIDSDHDPIRWLVHGTRHAARHTDATLPATGKPAGVSADGARSATAFTELSSDDGTLARWLRVLSAFQLRSPVLAAIEASSSRGVPYDDHEAGYWLVWRRLSRAERLALRQLADEGFLNPNNQDVVRSLMRDGLVRRDRIFHLTTRGFAQFVRRVVSPDTVASWEREGEGGGWDVLRGHLGSALAVAGAFVFFTQPDLFNSAVLTAGGLAAGVPTLLKLFSLFGDQRAGARAP